MTGAPAPVREGAAEYEKWFAKLTYAEKVIAETAYAAGNAHQNAALRQRLEAATYNKPLLENAIADFKAELTSLRQERDALRNALNSLTLEVERCCQSDQFSAKLHIVCGGARAALEKLDTSKT
jgi:chromosome segregation ATPase